MTDRNRPGVIGLGMIGGGIVSSLVKSGLSPTVFDVRDDASAAFGDAVDVASSPADVAGNCDVVLLAVVTAEQAESVLTAPDGVLAGAHDRTVVVLLSTVSLAEVRRLAGLCEDVGVAFADAGVTGGARAAENGLVVMLGAAEETADRVRPAMEAFARSVVHCGPVGTGMATKLARNAVTFSSWAAIREAAALASAAGVPVERLIEVLEAGTDDGTDQINALRTVVAGPSATDEQIAGAVRIVRKDLAAIQSLAGDLNIEVPIVDATVPDVEGIFRGLLPPVRE
jgi:3-hydroxyisobutyrate dehydrogenase